MTTPLRLIPVLEPIRPEMERVEGVLREALAEVEEPLGAALRRVLEDGKRLRPAMVVLTGLTFAAPLEPFYRLAAAVDMLHAATLIHDDLVDVSPLRRGQQTLHTAWPWEASVLAGDYLLAQATSLVADLGQARVLRVFGAALRTMCAGEIREVLVTQGRHNSREDYYSSIEAKTAALFAASAEMGGLLAGAEEAQVAALRRFGREFGMAFQIVDDVLDLTGDEAQLGKPAGSDLRQGLVTLPVLCYLERAEGESLVSGVLAGERDEERVRGAIEAIRASGAIEAALEEARVYVVRSQEALAGLPDNAARRMLGALAEYVVERER